MTVDARRLDYGGARYAVNAVSVSRRKGTGVVLTRLTTTTTTKLCHLVPVNLPPALFHNRTRSKLVSACKFEKIQRRVLKQGERNARRSRQVVATRRSNPVPHAFLLIRFSLPCFSAYPQDQVWPYGRVGPLVIWETEEVIDKLYEIRQKFNLTLSNQMTKFTEICKQEEVFCGRSRAVVYAINDINHNNFV